MKFESLSQIICREDPEHILEAAGRHLLSCTDAVGVVLMFDGMRDIIETRAGDDTPAVQAQLDTWTQAFRSTAKHAMPALHTTESHTVVTLPFASHCNGRSGYAGLLFNRIPSLDTASISSMLDVVGQFVRVRDEAQTARRRQEHLELLYEVGRELASTLDLDDLLYDTIRLVAEVMNAEAGTVMILDPVTNELVFQIAHGEKRDELSQLRLSTEQGVAGWVFQHGEPTIVNDPARDPRFADHVDKQTGYTTRNILCAPLNVKGRTIGVLQVLNKQNERGFDERDVELLLPLAGEAAIALENARLYRDLREERDKIIEAQEEVRRELARNLHDGTVQMLSSMQMSLSHARRLHDHEPDKVDDELAYLEDLVQRAIREARTLLFELRPVVLETRGLEAALASYVKRLNRTQTGPAVRLSFADDVPHLPQKVSRTLFALIQEAVSNARKHANATEIQVLVRLRDERLDAIVRDDGRGFDLAEVQHDYGESGSLGLLNMRERAEYINASLDLDCAPGTGTTVRVHLPVDLLPQDDEEQ